MRPVTLILSATIVCLGARAPLHAQRSDGAIAMDAGWQLRDSIRYESFDGRSVIAATNGFAFRRDVQLMDGTIDVDVMTTERRSFVYVMFRMQSESEYEDFYLRPHKSNAPDAFQYAPTYQSASARQLYHGANGTASVDIPDGVWNHLRIVLRGRQAAFFLNDTVKPMLVVNRLGHEPRAGFIALRGFLPAGIAGSGPIARYSNLRVRANYVPYTFAAPTDVTVPGVVRSWMVSAAFNATDSTPTSVPMPLNMRRVDALPNGLVELHRVIPLSPEIRAAGTVARVVVNADTTGLYRMDLGFSDRVTAFVNGRPMFSRSDAYDYLNRRDGLIRFDQATLFLPLRAGVNTLDFVVSDTFGGWGLMGRFPSMAGLRIVEP